MYPSCNCISSQQYDFAVALDARKSLGTVRKTVFILHVVTFHFFFFFQAEDGIRDADVTGVQTCALPISAPRAGLEPGLVLPNRLIGAIARAGPRDVAELAAVDGVRRWRAEVFGAEILEIGRASCRERV